MTRPWKVEIDARAIGGVITSHALTGLEKGAELVLELAQKDTPYLTQDLIKSGRSGLVDDKTAAVTFLDSKAVAVHEDLVHKRRHGRSAKFLENAFNSSRARVLELIAKEARRGLD